MNFMRSAARLYPLGPSSPSSLTKGRRIFTCKSLSNRVKPTWVRPNFVSGVSPAKTGDLSPYEPPSPNSLVEPFASHELLKNANDNVKKVFMVKNQVGKVQFDMYKQSLIDKVKAHKYDNSSWEVKIAKYTAGIRLGQYIISNLHGKGPIKKLVNELFHKRRRSLHLLRNADYKLYEWLLEKLDLKFVDIPVDNFRVTRKRGIKLLTEYEKEKMKEEKLGKLKEDLDAMKVPFLKKKIEKLKWIKEQEAALQLKPTVSDDDIESCVKAIETVKLDIAKRKKEGYIRKVHPFTFERYYEHASDPGK